MIGPITPAGGGFGGFGGMSIPSVRGAQSPPLGNPTALGSTATGGAAGLGGAASDIQGAVSQLLQSVGGGLENNQALRTLVTLLILLAVMEQMLSASGSNEKAPDMNQPNGEAAPGFTAQMTYTSLVIEQTSTTILYDTTGASGTSGGSAADAGRAMDFFV